MKRILFIGHDASRTGAPIGLLEFLKWLRAERPELQVDILLLRQGELAAEYGRVGQVFVMPDTAMDSLLRRGIRRFAESRRPRKLHIPRLEPFSPRYDAVVGNTVASLEYLEFFKSKGIMTVAWIHELEYALTRFFSYERLAALFSRVDHVIAVSKAVEANLRAMGFDSPASVIYEIAPAMPEPIIETSDVKRSLGFPDDAFLVGAGGTVEWRKGTDLFLQIAAARKADDVYFVWIGGRPEVRSEEFDRVQHDLRRMGLSDRVKFTGIVSDPGKYLAAIDVFALTSREDPYPLICLEAAAFGKPVICFADSGGMPEFVGEECGFIVPYLDMSGYAEKLHALFLDRPLVERLGSNAAEKVRATSDVSVIGPRVLSVIERVASGRGEH